MSFFGNAFFKAAKMKNFLGRFLFLLLFVPSVALSGLEHREYFDKYAPEVNEKLKAELEAQEVCASTCHAALGYWTMSPRENELEASIFIPNGKPFNRARVIDIFSEIHSRDNINITVSFYDGSHHDYENRKAKKVAMVKFVTYR